MTGFTPSLNRARVVLVLALASISVLSYSAVASAASSRSWISAYYTEAHTTVEEADSKTLRISCASGDAIVSATHKVDAIDFNLAPTLISSTVTYRPAGDHTADVALTFAEPGDDIDGDSPALAHVKVFATCLPAKTSNDEVLFYNSAGFTSRGFTTGYSSTFTGAPPKNSDLNQFLIKSVTVSGVEYGRKFYNKSATATANVVDLNTAGGETASNWAIAPGQTREFTVTCGGGYQAMYAEFAGMNADVKLVGSEPRGKRWVFRVYNSAGATTYTGLSANTKVLCYRKYTNKKRKV